VRRFEDFYRLGFRAALSVYKAGAYAAGDKRPLLWQRLSALLAGAYPEAAWRAWSFEGAHLDIWLDEAVVGRFIMWFEWMRKIDGREEWLRVSQAQLAEVGALPLHSRLKELVSRRFVGDVGGLQTQQV